MQSAVTDSEEFCAFFPDAERAYRAYRLDARMRTRLADSVRRVTEQARGHIPIPDEDLEGFLVQVRSEPAPPLIFGAYYELVLALETGELEAAASLLEEVATSSPAVSELLILDLDADSSRASNRYRRLFDTDGRRHIEMNPPGEAAPPYRSKILEALSLLDSGYPQLSAEIRALVREIVLAAGPADPKANQFGGVSSFMLWGALALNVSFPLSTAAMVETLAHESAHNLLFGLCVDGPLVENDVSEHYASPLRSDPRHLDGIYHATYVTARMHLALAELLAAGAFGPEDEAEARQANQVNEQNFAQGIETILAHAKLTPVGQKVMEGAREYMQSAGRPL